MNDPEDALRDLAAASSSGEDPIFTPEPEDATAGGRPESPVADRLEASPTAQDPAEMSASALAQLSGSGSVAYEPDIQPTPKKKRRTKKPDVGMIGIRTASVPVLITMGLIMTALGAWGLMVKNGNDTLPMADQDNAEQLAMVGLVGLPIALLLFASAGFMFYMVGKDKKKLARWEAAQEAEQG